MLAAIASATNCPALVLNADHRPLSYYPLSLWSWQDTIKAVFLERVTILEEYDRVVRSARFEMRLPSVVSLKTYIRPARRPAYSVLASDWGPIVPRLPEWREGVAEYMSAGMPAA